jgi:hypothetical protein
MTAERKYKMTTPHIDENPELESGDSGAPLAAYSTEGTAVSELYKDERDPFHYQPKKGETVIEEDVYIPDTE